MYIPPRRVVLSLPTKDETPRRERTIMFGHAASEMPHAAMHYKCSMQIDREKYLPVYSINIVCHRSSYFL